MISLQFLAKFGEILRKSLSNEETFKAVFDILDEIVAFDSATLFVADSRSGELRVVERRGSQLVDLASEVTFSKGEGLSGWIASQREPVVLSVLSSTKPNRFFRSLVSIPLWVGERPQGVLNLGHTQPGFFRPEDKVHFAQLGTQLSLIVEQLRLRSELHKKNIQLAKTLEELQAAEEALVEKERLAAIGEVVVRLKHEINNPLAVIVGLADTLSLRYGKDDPELLTALEKVKSAAMRINNITRRLEQLRSSASEEYLEGVRMVKLD
jgi:transcriptional regulator with GAF, ATPase, and Fis domain